MGDKSPRTEVVWLNFEPPDNGSMAEEPEPKRKRAKPKPK